VHVPVVMHQYQKNDLVEMVSRPSFLCRHVI